MTETTMSILERIRPRIPREEARSAPAPALRSVPTFVVENPDTGKIVVTMPLEIPAEVAAGPSSGITAEDFLLRLSGRFVEAEAANANGAFWAQEDLEFGMPSIAHGPLNWLHDDRRVIGTITGATLVNREAAAKVNLNTHVRADSVVWRWLAGPEAAALEMYAGQKQAWYSMECISRQVACVGDNGCGAVMDYLDAQNKTERACAHVKERASSRRFVSPIFQGGAVIVPPTKPGWGLADLETMRQAAKATERAHIEVPGLDTEQAEAMVAQVMAWAAA